MHKKYHTGDCNWRGLSIKSGADAGGCHVVEGALSWDQFDKRGIWVQHILPIGQRMCQSLH